LANVEKELRNFIDNYLRLAPATRQKLERDLSRMVGKMQEPVRSLFRAFIEFIRAGVTAQTISPRAKKTKKRSAAR